MRCGGWGVSYAIRLGAGEKVRLSHYDPDETHHLVREEGERKMAELGEELSVLQELLYASHDQAVLVVLQGMDTSGKDGTIKHVMQRVNPAGCQVASFKQPTPLEASHDFLWRAHLAAPPRGMMSIFNRSYYEDVLVTRVHGQVNERECERRYEHINHFERLLADEGTIVLKFFLHISKSEQRTRLLDRENTPDKMWKLSVADWQERSLWDAYITAYEDALSACTTEHAPWWIVPANNKWLRNLAIAEAIVQALRPERARWAHALSEHGRQALAALQAIDRA